MRSYDFFKGGGFNNFFSSPLKLGRWSNLTSIFFRWVGSTLVQPPSRFERYDFPGELEAQRANFRSRLVFANFPGGLVRWIYFTDRYTHLQLGLSRVLEELHICVYIYIHNIYNILHMIYIYIIYSLKIYIYIMYILYLIQYIIYVYIYIYHKLPISTERTPNPEYLVAPAIYLGVCW